MQAMEFLPAVFITGVGIAFVWFKRYFSSKGTPGEVAKDYQRLRIYGAILLTVGLLWLTSYFLGFAALK